MNPQTSIPLEVVRHALRMNLPFIAIAGIVLVAGIASLVLWRLSSRDRLLLWLTIFAVIYGVRLFLENDLVRTASGTGSRVFQVSVMFLTYTIPIPLALFFRELLGAGWKRSISIWLWIEIAFAPLAIVTGIIAGEADWADLTNEILIIIGTLVILLHVLLPKSPGTHAGALKWPLLLFAIFVLANNFRFRPGGINIEPFGFLILLAGLSYTASRRAVASERKLTEVEQELATARRIQNSILPRTSPHVAALRIATRYQPMTAVAGDFYDFIKTSEDSLTILVADVSGHGVPAALVASMLKICFAAQRDQAREPAKVLAGFNTMLRDVLEGQYVTAACAAVDLRTQTVTYAGAGHPPALLLRKKNGDLIQLAENGLFIGPFPNATYASVSAPFESGDKLLLYTDGVVEATVADGQEFGRARLAEFLLDRKNLEPAAFVEQLFARISTPAQEDDLTVVLAEFE